MTTHDDLSPTPPSPTRAKRDKSRSSASGRVIAIRPPGTHDEDVPDLASVPRWLAVAENHSIVLDRHRLAATTRYACTGWRIPKALMYWTWCAIRGCFREVTYPIHGAGKVADAIYAWGAALDHENAAKVALGTTHAYRGAERHVNAKTWRTRILLVAASAVAILSIWLGYRYPSAGIVTLITLAGVLDIIGRRGKPKSEAPPVKPRPLVEGMPTHLLKAELQIVLEEEGYIELITISDVILDIIRHEYHVSIVTHTEIKPELLRQIERRINAPINSIRMTIDEVNSADRVLSIRMGNPLANVPELEWLPYGKKSAWDPLLLGASADPDTPYQLVFAGQHVSIVGATGSAKTTVHMNNGIDRLAACRDAVQWGITLDKASNFTAWRSVLAEKAFTVDEALNLLQSAIMELNRRDAFLTALAEDDDPTNDQSEWSSELGPALVIWIDEFPQLAEWDGTKLDENGDKPNLLVLVEKLLRLGRGLGISVNIGQQATGNNDTGSSVVAKQTTIKIVGPCSMADTVAIFGKDKRDQGYAPHLLKPAKLGGSHNDAGMAVIDGAGFGPDYVRGGKPFKVKARAMRREAEWEAAGHRPTLDVHGSHLQVVNAVTVPTALAVVEAALNFHEADVLSTATVVEHANSHGGTWSQTSLADALATESPKINVKGRSEPAIKSRSGRCRIKRKPLQCYHREDLDTAMRILENGS